MADITKKQHFIPQMMLKFFTDGKDNRFWEYNLNSHLLTKKRTDEVFFQNLIYEVRDERGKYYYEPGKNSMEKGFGIIETDFSVFLGELITELDGSESIICDNDRRDQICTWIAFMFARNPLVLKAIPLVADEYNIELINKISKAASFLKLMPKEIEDIRNDLMKGHITFLKASDEDCFVLSDFPVLFYGVPMHEWCYMPVSSKYAILVKKPDNALVNNNRCFVNKLSRVETFGWNYRMYALVLHSKESEFHAGNSVISEKKHVLEKLISVR